MYKMFLRPGFVVVIVGATLTGMSTIIVALRYYCRYILMGTIGSTDHLMMVAVLFSWGNLVINYYQDVYSRQYRPSFLRIPDKRPGIIVALRGTLLTWWLYRMSYVMALMFIKLSILFFYRAIASHRTFRRLVYATIVFVCLYSFACTVASAFQCRNPGDSFDTTVYLAQFDRNPNTSGPKQVHCYDPTKLWVFSSAVNLFTDVVILLLPIPALLSLRVPMSKRLALVGIFSVGIMAIVASCVRMWVMMLWAESPFNSARFGADMLLWGQVETNAGIISASIPFLRLLFRGRQKERERGVEDKPRVISPPKFIEQQANTKALEIDTVAFFGPHNANASSDEEQQGSPMWKPFITVPASLSESGSRGSGMLEPTHPHATV